MITGRCARDRGSNLGSNLLITSPDYFAGVDSEAVQHTDRQFDVELTEPDEGNVRPREQTAQRGST
jgi:hypothetical protein